MNWREIVTSSCGKLPVYDPTKDRNWVRQGTRAGDDETNPETDRAVVRCVGAREASEGQRNTACIDPDQRFSSMRQAKIGEWKSFRSKQTVWAAFRFGPPVSMTMWDTSSATFQPGDGLASGLMTSHGIGTMVIQRGRDLGAARGSLRRRGHGSGRRSSLLLDC